MVMADAERIGILLKQYNYSTDDDLEDEGISEGDSEVEQYLISEIDDFMMPSTIPTVFIDAATYYAASSILTILTTNQETQSPAIKEWKDKARSALDRYIKDYLLDKQESRRGIEIFVDSIYNENQTREDRDEVE